MRNRIPLFFLFFSALTTITSCTTHYQPQSAQYAAYRIKDSVVSSKILQAVLQPYTDSVNKNMNDVIAVANTELEKKQPEGTLGNMMADAMLVKAKEMYGTVDGAFINNGGLRLPVIPKGNITRGKIYELAPFDNDIVLQKLSGNILQDFLSHISARGGWPVAGIKWQIKNKHAINVLVNGQPINENAVYNIAMIDYVANGGDDCNMLRSIPQLNKKFILRDAIIEYLTAHTRQGKAVTAQIENRVTNAE